MVMDRLGKPLFEHVEAPREIYAKLVDASGASSEPEANVHLYAQYCYIWPPFPPYVN